VIAVSTLCRRRATFMTALVVAGVVLTCAGVAAAQAAPVAGIASTPGQGYWVAGSDGGVFAYGDAGFSGSLGGQSLNKPVVGIAAVPDGQGYWLASGDGGIFAFGSAGFFGSLGGSPLNKPVVGIAAAPDGKGYWLVSSNGGVFAFGSAQFHGSLGDRSLNAPIVAIAAAPDSNGYWLTAADGGVFGFGSARFFGAMATARLNGPVVGIARTSTGGGYWLVAADGGVFTFGDAQFRGSPAPVVPPAPLPAPVPPGARGKVTVLRGGMDPGRPALQPALVDYLERMAGAAGREIVVLDRHQTQQVDDQRPCLGSLVRQRRRPRHGREPRHERRSGGRPAHDRVPDGGRCGSSDRRQPRPKRRALHHHSEWVEGPMHLEDVPGRRPPQPRARRGGVAMRPVLPSRGRAPLVALLAALCTAGVLFGTVSPMSSAASRPRLCPDLVFRKQSDDLFYDIRTRGISCRSARKVLRRYRAHNKRCISGWRCTYGVEPKWAVEPRIRLSRKGQQIYFGVPG
jgi:hypothetical protein